MTHIDYQWYAAHVSDANKEAANDAARAVGGNFCNPYDDLFSIPCHTDTGETPTRWATKIRLDPTQRAVLGGVLGGLGIVTRLLRARGEKLPDDFDLFLADSQLRQYKDGDGFVHTTGTFKASGSADAQAVTTTAALVNQWTSQHNMVNAALQGGAGNPRIEIDFGGDYYFDTHIAFEETGTEYQFRLVKNLGYASGIFSGSTSPVVAKTTVEGFAATDKLGLSVQVATGSETFKLLGLSWFGLKRVG